MTVGGPPRGRSYQGQDLFVLEVLGGMRGGFFLDSGASDGVKGSNTVLLEEEYGWTGICVEPNADLFAALVRNRSCTCVNCCLYDRDGTVEFFEAAAVYGGIVAEYDPGHLDFARSMAPPGSASSVTTKPARSVRSLLREHGAPRVLDYWSLDTEGSELAILRAFPFDEYRFRVLTVEHNGSPDREPIRRLLEDHGYRRVATFGIDDGYVGREDLGPRAWRSGAWARSRRARA